MLERELQIEINNDLRNKGIKFYHCEAGRTFNRLSHRGGWPDLMIFKGDYNVFFVEIKVNNNVLSIEQKLFQKWAADMKYNCYEVRNILQWMAVKKMEGIIGL